MVWRRRRLLHALSIRRRRTGDVPFALADGKLIAFDEHVAVVQIFDVVPVQLSFHDKTGP